MNWSKKCDLKVRQQQRAWKKRLVCIRQERIILLLRGKDQENQDDNKKPDTMKRNRCWTLSYSERAKKKKDSENVNVYVTFEVFGFAKFRPIFYHNKSFVMSRAFSLVRIQKETLVDVIWINNCIFANRQKY